MSLTTSAHWMYNSGGSFYDHLIEQSVRITTNSSLKNDTVAGTTRNYDSAKIFTYSCWFKPQGNGVHLISLNDTPATGEFTILYDNDNTFRVYSNGQFDGDTTAVFRDFSAWYHVCLVMDTTQATAANRARLYINGTLHALSSQPSQNLNVKAFTTATRGAIGARYQDNGTINYQAGNGAFRIAEFIYADGVKHEPTVFGETKSGVWIPKDISSISLGTNGYHLDFSDQTVNTSITTNSGFGKDIRSNMPNPQWITEGFLSTHDGMPDSPTNNYPVINPNETNDSGSIYSQGNLRFKTVASGSNVGVATFEVPKTGKWYWEVRIVSTSGTISDHSRIGIQVSNAITPSLDVRYKSNGDKSVNNSSSSYGASYAASDIISVAVDADGNTVEFYKNGVSQGSISYTMDASSTYFPVLPEASGTIDIIFAINFGQDSTFFGQNTSGGNTDANGYGDFKYSVPSGYLALNSANLPEPSITPLDDDIPEDYFEANLWTGNGTSQSISSYEFSPDFVWIKERNSISSHNLYNTIMGTDLFLRSNTTDSEISNTVNLTSFDSNGFSLGSGGNTNENNNTYVGWCWKAGGTAVSNTDGSITSSVSANTKAGFSIVGYTGNGVTGATIGHGLSSAPECILIKDRDDTSAWAVGHVGLASDPWTDVIILNSTAAKSDNAAIWNDTPPTSSIITLGSSGSANDNGNGHIAYCFHSVEGYSKFGSYSGNGANDGAFVYTGFRPAFVIQKVRSGDTGSWLMYDNKRDTFNQQDKYQRADTNVVDQTSAEIDFLSNGFKYRGASAGTGTQHNASGDTYIYMAFAEMPFKYANAR